MGQMGLFDTENNLAELSKLGDPLEKLNIAIPWKRFKPILTKTFHKERKSNAGRPPFDYIMMFKILVLQHMYNLSDAQVQFQLLDRYTFRRFTGINSESNIPDEKTIWLFRETLTKREAAKKLFDLFDRFLNEAGYHAKKGMIVDASFVEVPRQRNTKKENDQVKNGIIPPKWEKDPDKLAQKDLDARWMTKNRERHYGYKNHVNVDVKHKMIRVYDVTSAQVHDSQPIDNLIDKDNTRQAIYGDSAYSSAKIESRMKRKGMINLIHKRAYRNTPLSTFQISQNKKKSKIRARVEHVFARIDRMVGKCIRCVGRQRAAARIGIINLVYNMFRYTYLVNLA